VSRTGRIAAEFAGEERDFRLAWGELMDLQEKRDAGPSVVLARLSLGQWQLQDVTETIRLGLVGGGADTATAARLVRQHVEQRPWELGGENGLVVLAVRILAAALHGAPDEPLGKAGERPNGSTISPTERSASEPSSATPS
jgi:hypothetical protein